MLVCGFVLVDRVPINAHQSYSSMFIFSLLTFQEESDLQYEEEILRHPYQIKCWIRYIEHKSAAPKSVINLIYERALKQLPGR